MFKLCYADESTGLSTRPDFPMNKYTEDEKSYGDIITAGAFLNRIQLYTGSSPAIAAGHIGMGHFGYVKAKDKIDDLGLQIDCIPLSWRFKAMDFTGEMPISVYDPTAPEFARIRAASSTEDSQCSYGLEFLLWIPSIKVFATYFFNSKTSRRSAPNLKNLIEQRSAASIKSDLIVRGKKSWHGPLITMCSTPLAEPDWDEARKQAENFANPKESDVQKVTAEPAGASGRPQ